MMQRILVTGGAGFIGSHMVDFLLKKEHEVYVVDDLSTGKIENIESHLSNERFHFEQGDITELKILEEICENVDIIFHLASSVGVAYIMDKSIKSLDSNILGNIRLTKLAALYDKPLILFSSSEIYGKSDSNDYEENQDRVLGSSFRWSYAVGKLVGEYYVEALAEKKGLRYLIVRCFNIVGPRQSSAYGMVLPRFIKQALENKPITVYDDGEQIRTFTSVYDLVEILYNLSIEKQCYHKTLNLGSYNTISINQLAKMIIEITKSNSRIVYVPSQKIYGKDFDDTRNRIPDLKRLEKIVGYHKYKNIEEIIYSFIEC